MHQAAAVVGWSGRDVLPSLAGALRVLAKRYPIVEGDDNRSEVDIRVRFEHVSDARVTTTTLRDGQAVVRYSRLSRALRAVGWLMSRAEDDMHEQTCEEPDTFDELGVMLDVSRGAVVTAAHFQRWLERLALLGFTTAMLYTEDMYRLPDEPCFGYARGAYTADELRQIDDHAHALGIEMVPCIQTLGHLEQVLKWWRYDDIKDTESVLLADDDRTYELIGKMLDHWSGVFRSRRIHVGMDEAYQLGRGRFCDRHGHQPGRDIFVRHLQRLASMCGSRGLSMMLWSDMLFQLENKSGEQYDVSGDMPVQAASRLPRDVSLVYWDYYKADKQAYAAVIERHRALGFEPVVASAVTTPYRFWYDRQEMRRTALPCIDACREQGAASLFFTMWGDDGAYCDFDSAQAGLAEVAEYAYSRSSSKDISIDALARRFAVVCGGSLEAHHVAAALHQVPAISTPGVLWDDPILGIYLRSRSLCGPETLPAAAAHFQQLATRLAAMNDAGGAGLIAHAHQLAAVLGAKLSLAHELHTAYARKDRDGLAAVARQIEPLYMQIELLAESFRAMWMTRNKPFGLEVIQIRLAGLVARYRELARRLDAMAQGGAVAIDELDEPSPGRHGYAQYQRLATGSARL